LFPVYSFANHLIYKSNNKYFKFGYFSNFDGIGIEIGYRFAGFDITLPITFYLEDIDYEIEMEKPFYIGILNFVKNAIIFYSLHTLTKFIFKKINEYKKRVKKDLTNELIETRKKVLLESKESQSKIILQIKPQAEKNHSKEIKKGENGLIIHFALYGRSKNLKNLMNEIHFIDNIETYIQEICNDVESEIIDVTIPIRYLIKQEENSLFSTVFLYQAPKTKVIGFINPIFKSDRQPCLLIK
jgi:hypothetical protein